MISEIQLEQLLSEYSILVVGGDHYNTLATVRCLGRAKVPFGLLLHGSRAFEATRVSKSVYSPQDGIAVGDSEESLVQAISNWAESNSQSKQIVYTCSDHAERIVEQHFPQLLHPGFKKSEPRVLDLMNKRVQADWARALDIEVAREEVLDFNTEINCENVFKKYGHCIFKPVESALGAKADIRFAEKESDVEDCVSFFMGANYTSILVQQFVDFDYELNANGCVLGSGEIIWHLIKKEQIHPLQGGSLAYGVLENRAEIREQVQAFLDKVADCGYCGPFDIEFFVKGNSVSLNECNFRQSGLMFSIVERGVPLPLMWIASLAFENVGEHVQLNSSHEESFANERFLLASIVKREEKMALALKRLIKAKHYAYWAKDDLRGSIAWYR